MTPDIATAEHHSAAGSTLELTFEMLSTKSQAEITGEDLRLKIFA